MKIQGDGWDNIVIRKNNAEIIYGRIGAANFSVLIPTNKFPFRAFPRLIGTSWVTEIMRRFINEGSF